MQGLRHDEREMRSHTRQVAFGASDPLVGHVGVGLGARDAGVLRVPLGVADAGLLDRVEVGRVGFDGAVAYGGDDGAEHSRFLSG